MINFKEIEERAKKENRKKEKKQHFWSYRIETKNYSILWWALPVAIPCVIYNELRNLYYKKIKWSDERGKRVLDRILSKRLEPVTDETGKECYMFFTNYPSYTYKKYASLRDKLWLNKFDYTLSNYLADTYEIDGYKKEVVSRGGFDECEIYFYKIGG